MGVQFRQNARSFEAKGVVATMTNAKRAEPRRMRKVEANVGPEDAMATLTALAQVYELVADGLLDQIHSHAGNLRVAQALSQHLDWVGTRAQMIGSFIKAGDCALTYICASSDAHARLLPLVHLAAENVAQPGRLPVALYLMEKIDEELRLV